MQQPRPIPNKSDPSIWQFRGLTLAVAGLITITIGVWLTRSGVSYFFLLAGLVSLITGAIMFRLHSRGYVVCAIAVTATVFGAWIDAQSDLFGFCYRLTVPISMILAVLIAPYLAPRYLQNSQTRDMKFD